MRKSVVDEDLADGATDGEEEDIFAHRRMSADEGEGGGEFAVGRRRKVEEGEQRCSGCENGGEEEICGCEQCGEKILRDHHLGTRVGAERAEDVILGAVRETVEEEVDAKQRKTP